MKHWLKNTTCDVMFSSLETWIQSGMNLKYLSSIKCTVNILNHWSSSCGSIGPCPAIDCKRRSLMAPASHQHNKVSLTRFSVFITGGIKASEEFRKFAINNSWFLAGLPHSVCLDFAKQNKAEQCSDRIARLKIKPSLPSNLHPAYLSLTQQLCPFPESSPPWNN